jgi:hypothetical protein
MHYIMDILTIFGQIVTDMSLTKSNQTAGPLFHWLLPIDKTN